MTADIYLGGSSYAGVDVRAYPDGVYISGWYDSMVGIDGGFLTWAQLDKLRAKARRRNPFNASQKWEVQEDD